MNILQKTSRKVIKASFDLSISGIEHFSDMTHYHEKVDQLRQLENGTLGKEIADCLDHHNLNLVPHYESHDLKHVLLDFKMTTEDEIRMQAFMIGNGNHSFPSFAIFFFGAILLPELLPTFYSDFLNGRSTIPISTWTIENYAARPINELRTELHRPSQVKENIGMQRLTQLTAFSTVIAGILGMIFCLPFLFSSNMADLVGAGFPFVAGAILVAGGLLALSNMTTKRMVDQKEFSLTGRI